QAGIGAAPRPGLSAQALHLVRRRRGLRRMLPEGFRRIDLSLPDYDMLPPEFRLAMLRSQNAIDEFGPDLSHAIRLHGWLDALHASHPASRLDPHAKEWM
ncbi:MAG: hypothetical protein HQL37_14975, partial [Alphaproteobacteria bacterium]|nr:hypothetical protein [Alphaproteobacteria bacterium]